MIIIYNLSGLVLAGAGVVAGLLVVMLTGWLSPGLLTLAVIWFAGGFWWRNQELSPGVKRPFPALFFIPLPFLAIPLASVAALGFLLIEWGAHTQPRDPRTELFQADERMLESAAVSGDVQLSQKIRTALPLISVPGKTAAPYNVATRKNGDAVLVLVKAPALKNYTDDVRRTLLLQITDTLRADEQLKGKRIFIGIKGQLTYGAVQSPPNGMEIGSVIDESRLYDFYGDSAVPGSVALAGRPTGGKVNLATNIPVQRSNSSDALPDANAGAQELQRNGANRVERKRPDNEQRRHDEIEDVKLPEDNPAALAKTEDEQAVKNPEDSLAKEDEASPAAIADEESPGEKTEDAPAATAQEDKATTRAKKIENARSEGPLQASKRDMERAARKKRSDDQMAELRKRHEERMAEAKKQNNERLAELKQRGNEHIATSMLETAQSLRKVGSTRDYRKRLKEIADKYPETEAGKKAKKLLK